MPKFTIEPDQETYEHLVRAAVAEKRRIDWQAEVELRRAFGLPFPKPAIDALATSEGPALSEAPVG